MIIHKGGGVIGGAFGIGSGWVKVPKAVAFAVGYELSAVFLRFALVHEPAIQGSGGEPATIFVAHRFRGSHRGCSSCQFVGLPDVFQPFPDYSHDHHYLRVRMLRLALPHLGSDVPLVHCVHEGEHAGRRFSSCDRR